VLSGRGLCDELITRPEESYRLWCAVVCDLETSRIGAPYIYIYDISNLRVNNIKYERIRQTHLVYLIFIVELATCFDPAGSSSGLYVHIKA